MYVGVGHWQMVLLLPLLYFRLPAEYHKKIWISKKEREQKDKKKDVPLRGREVAYSAEIDSFVRPFRPSSDRDSPRSNRRGLTFSVFFLRHLLTTTTDKEKTSIRT